MPRRKKAPPTGHLPLDMAWDGFRQSVLGQVTNPEALQAAREVFMAGACVVIRAVQFPEPEGRNLLLGLMVREMDQFTQDTMGGDAQWVRLTDTRSN